MRKITWMAFALAVACTDKGDDSGGGDGGGGDGGADTLSCDDAFSACGGDLTGNWSIAGVCYDYTYSDDECPDATWDFGFDITGELGVTGDGSYTLSSASTVTISFSIPKDCMGPATCADLESDLYTCVDAGAACECGGVQSSSEDEVGTWETAGSVLTLTTADGDVTVSDYCARPTTFDMQIRPESPEEPAMRILFGR